MVRTLWVCCITALALGLAQSSPAEEAYFDQTFKVTLGKDIGQRLGSVFEAVDADGNVLLGAGFNDIHSTYLRDNNRVLDFFFKAKEYKSEIRKIAKPFGPEHNASRLIIDGDRLLVFFRDANPVNLQVLEGDAFVPETELSEAEKGRFCGVQYVNNKRMVFGVNQAWYGGFEIFNTTRPAKHYYCNGKFFAFHLDEPRELHVYKWDPESEPVVSGTPEKFPVDGYLFVFGTYGDEVMVFTNNGCVYSYLDGELRTIRLTDGKSWQAYSTSNWFDRFLIGQYPTGSLFDYADLKMELFDPKVPMAPGAADKAREAQTFTIYGGDLYVGVWPWGELWRLDSNTKQWDYTGRAFEQPPINEEDVAFQDQMKGKPGDYNLWGQRIMNLVGTSDGLHISTMSKRGDAYKEDYNFIPEEVVGQYGMIHRLVGVAQASRQIVWKPETTLRFVYDAKGLSVYQDGELFATKALETSAGLEGRKIAQVRAGKGIYGEFTGSVVGPRE